MPPRPWLLLALALPACIDGPSRAVPTIPVPSAHRVPFDADPARAPDEADPESTPPAPTAPDVGADLSASPAQPGHYALDMRYHQESACSQSWDSYSAHGSLVLDLSTDGTAVACRGKHMNDVGPEFHREMMEQQGFRGTWHRDGAWTDITLALDDTACPQRRGYTNLAPSPWHLRCVTLTPTPGGDSPITQPLLGCQFVTPVYSEALGYQVEGIFAQPWVLLGAGDGVRIELQQGALMAMVEERFVVARPPAPITIDAWMTR